MAGEGQKVAIVGGASLVGVGVGALLARRPAEPAPPNEKLDYIIETQEAIIQLLGELAMPSLDRLIALVKGQFMSDPEGACSLINSHQPNLCRAAVTGVVVTLAPGATTTYTAELAEGFVQITTSLNFYTDVPFAVQAVMLKDSEVWYVDPGLAPGAVRLRNWQEATYRWEIQLTNTSAVAASLHIILGGWEVETKTLRNIKAVLASLSYATSEYGTPEGAPE